MYFYFFSIEDEFPKTVQQAKVPLISSISCRSYWGLEIKNTNICGGASGSSSCMVIKAIFKGRRFISVLSPECLFTDQKEVQTYGSLKGKMRGISPLLS